MKPKLNHPKEEQSASLTLPTEPLWTVDDVANYLRLKQETVRIMARTNMLPAIKIGRSWRFRIKDITQSLKTTRTPEQE